MPKTMTSRPPKSEKKLSFVDILHQDHEKVKALFKKFEATEAKKQKKKIVHEILTELRIHTQAEEEIVYPALRQVAEAEMMNEADEEHHVAKVLIHELENYSGDDGHYDAKVIVLKEIIEHHVEEEEGEMFRKARKVDDPEGVAHRLLSRKKELTHQYVKNARILS